MEAGHVQTRTKGKGLGAKSIALPFLLILLLTLVAGLVAAPSLHATHRHNPIDCPAPITEGEAADMRVHWNGYNRLWLRIFTYNRGHAADHRDYVGYFNAFFEGQPGNSPVSVPVITKEDSIPEPDETFGIGFFRHGSWHGCVVTIIDDDTPSRPLE